MCRCVSKETKHGKLKTSKKVRALLWDCVFLLQFYYLTLNLPIYNMQNWFKHTGLKYCLDVLVSTCTRTNSYNDVLLLSSPLTKATNQIILVLNTPISLFNQCRMTIWSGTVSDDQLHIFSSCKTWVGANMSFLHLHHPPPFSFFFLFCVFHFPSLCLTIWGKDG